MSYYGTDTDTAETESSFDDPTAELESNGAADDPEGDLGDGRRKRLPRNLENFTPARHRTAAEEISF